MRGAHLQSRFELDAGHTAFTATRDARLTPHHTENLNTPRLVADDTQKTVWKWEQQEPFGAGACNPDPDGDNVQFEFNLRFPGQYFDRETNAHYNWFRDYDSSSGRYTSSDPAGLAGGLNTYIYTLADPLQWSDPLGLEPGSIRQRGYPPAGVEFCFLPGSLAGGGAGYPHYFTCVNGRCSGFYPGVGGGGQKIDDSGDYTKATCQVANSPCDQGKFMRCIAERNKPGVTQQTYSFLGRNCKSNAERDIQECRQFSCDNKWWGR